MITTEKNHSEHADDAALVAESLAGGRDAFRRIVERHQTLVCSLAYCATGSLTQSEDLAQETFLAAWRQLAELREPSKLRPWLCGIARFVIGKELRRQGREPIHAAETLEMVNDLAGPEQMPSERAVSKEEEAILWHCVARIPEIYREPLVLFYREHQSIERVAEALELSEDAVKQRLARGRKLLQEEALAYVEGALQNTNPSHTFTAGVLAALPLATTSAKALTVGAAVKGSSTLKTFASLAALGVILLYWSVVGFLVFAGGCAGYWMSRACARSARQCENITCFWRTLAWGFAVCFVVRQTLFSLYVAHVLAFSPAWFNMKLTLDLFYASTVAALAIWLHRWWYESSIRQPDMQYLPRLLKRRFVLWLSLGMIVPACWFVPIIGGPIWHAFGPTMVQHLSEAQLQKIINERKDAYFTVMQEEGRAKTLEVVLPENAPDRTAWSASHLPGWWKKWVSNTEPSWWIDFISWTGWRPVQMSASADESTIHMLKEKGIHYMTGTITHGLGDAWPFGSLLPFFIGPMGVVIILRRIRKSHRPMTAPGVPQIEERETDYGRMLLALRADQAARTVFWFAFATAFLLAFSANAFPSVKIFTAMGLYIVLFLGSIKGAFFGLVAGVGALYLRCHRKNAVP